MVNPEFDWVNALLGNIKNTVIGTQHALRGPLAPRCYLVTFEYPTVSDRFIGLPERSPNRPVPDETAYTPRVPALRNTATPWRPDSRTPDWVGLQEHPHRTLRTGRPETRLTSRRRCT